MSTRTALLESALRSILNTIGPLPQTIAEVCCRRIAEKALHNTAVSEQDKEAQSGGFDGWDQ
jgi:hypothetical protein